jgi:hypothetical protein
MQEQIETFGMMLVKGVIAPAFLAFLTWAAARLGAWIHSKVRNETTAGVLDRLGQLAINVVQEVEQTVVSALPDRADKAALLAARDQALATLRSHLGEKGLRELMTVFGLKDDDAVVRLLLSYIESSVLTLKMQHGPVTTTMTKTEPSYGVEKTTSVIQPGKPTAAATTINAQGVAP